MIPQRLLLIVICCLDMCGCFLLSLTTESGSTTCVDDLLYRCCYSVSALLAVAVAVVLAVVVGFCLMLKVAEELFCVFYLLLISTS